MLAFLHAFFTGMQRNLQQMPGDNNNNNNNTLFIEDINR
jgi:hypothetical protein